MGCRGAKVHPYGCTVDFAALRLSALDYRHQPEETVDNLLRRLVALDARCTDRTTSVE